MFRQGSIRWLRFLCHSYINFKPSNTWPDKCTTRQVLASNFSSKAHCHLIVGSRGANVGWSFSPTQSRLKYLNKYWMPRQSRKSFLQTNRGIPRGWIPRTLVVPWLFSSSEAKLSPFQRNKSSSTRCRGAESGADIRVTLRMNFNNLGNPLNLKIVFDLWPNTCETLQHFVFGTNYLLLACQKLRWWNV